MTRWIPLEERWSRRENTATHRALWSREAYLYDRQPTADWRTEGFMKVVAELDLLTPESTVLDVGCGAGVYTAAFAQRAGDVLGVDLSASMVEAGRRRAQRENLPNLRFEVLRLAGCRHGCDGLAGEVRRRDRQNDACGL